MDENTAPPLIDRQAPTKLAHNDRPGSSSAIPRFAINAATSQMKRLTDILAAAADTIDAVIAQNSATLPRSVSAFTNSASSSLRNLADHATEEKAEELLQSLQRRAAQNPVATASIGAAIGTALGVALSRLNRSKSNKPI